MSQKLRQLPPRRRVAFAACVVAALIAGVLVGAHIGSERRRGAASEVLLDSKSTGVFRLAVVSGARGPHRVVPSDHLGAKTADQQHSVDIGWGAACSVWRYFGVLGVDTAYSCATTTARPPVSFAGGGTGLSSGLADTLAFADWHFEITGDIRVAATGEVRVRADESMRDPDGSVFVSATVHDVGGIAEKVAAAVAANADVLLVPQTNAAEAARGVERLGADLEVVGVSYVSQAVHEVCARSLTEVCRERVLPVE